MASLVHFLSTAVILTGYPNYHHVVTETCTIVVFATNIIYNQGQLRL